MAKTIVQNPCPRCGRPGTPSGARLFFCGTCQMEFEPDTGDGEIPYGDPAKIVERRENRRLTEKERRRRL